MGRAKVDPLVLVGQVRQLQAEAASLAAKNERLAAGLKRAKQRLEQVDSQLEKLRQPPLSYAVCTGLFYENKQLVALEAMVGARRMRLAVHPSVKEQEINAGSQLLINSSQVVVGVSEPMNVGEAVYVSERLDNERVLVTTSSGSSKVLQLAPGLQRENLDQPLRSGDMLAAHLEADLALSLIERTGVQDLIVPDSPNISFEEIGGLADAVSAVRDAIELPFTHPQLYRSYNLSAPKGVLLYGPPGCGKTLIAKAVATSLAHARGQGDAAFFNIKGPELLDKYVGESERQIRTIFEQARRLADEQRPVVIFFDEMEALLRRRGSGISSDMESTIVPQMLAEIDGVEALNNVVIIGATNREDMLDPAVLRPGRLDVKIYIGRPDKLAAGEILAKHLTSELPIASSELARAGSRQDALQIMIGATVEALYAASHANEILEITYVNGASRKVYASELISGAYLAAVVARAKTLAIKRELAGAEGGISTALLLEAVAQAGREQEELNASTDSEGWLRQLGERPVMVRSVKRAKH